MLSLGNLLFLLRKVHKRQHTKIALNRGEKTAAREIKQNRKNKQWSEQEMCVRLVQTAIERYIKREPILNINKRINDDHAFEIHQFSLP